MIVIRLGFNNNANDNNITLFQLACKVVRVINQPRGNMLLIGIGGSGRQSLSRLAAYICEYKTFQVEVTKHYRKQEFREGMLYYVLLQYINKFIITIIILEFVQLNTSYSYLCSSN